MGKGLDNTLFLPIPAIVKAFYCEQFEENL